MGQATSTLARFSRKWRRYYQGCATAGVQVADLFGRQGSLYVRETGNLGTVTNIETTNQMASQRLQVLRCEFRNESPGTKWFHEHCIKEHDQTYEM